MDDNNTTSWLYHLPPITFPAKGETISHPNPHKLVAFYLNQGPDHRYRRLVDIRNYSDQQLENIHDYIQWLFPLPEGSDFNPNAPLVTKEVAAAFRKDPKLREELRASFDMMMKTWGFVWDSSYVNEVDGSKSNEHKERDTKEELGISKAGGLKTEAMDSIPAAKKRKFINTPLSPSFPSDPPRPSSAQLQMGRLTRITGPQAFLKKSRNWFVPRSHNHLRITRIIRCLRVLGLPREAEAFYQALINASAEVEVRGPSRDSLMYWRRAAKRPLWIQPSEDLEEEEDVEVEEIWCQAGVGEDDEEEEEEEEEEEARGLDHEEQDTMIMEYPGSKGGEVHPKDSGNNGKDSTKVHGNSTLEKRRR